MSAREDWLAARRTGIGGSDIAAVLGLSPWKTPLAVYLDKIGEGEAVDETEAMRWGTIHEPTIAREYERRTGHEIREAEMMRSARYPWMLASVDRLIESPFQGVLEIKTARTAQGWGEEGTDEVPVQYLLQVQHYLVVTEREVAEIAVLIGGSDFRIYRVPFHAEIAQRIIEEGGRFWRDNVLAHVPPPARTMEDARQKWPQATEREVFASEEVQAAALRLAEIKAEIKERETQAESLQARICDAIGDGDALVGADGRQGRLDWAAGRTR